MRLQNMRLADIETFVIVPPDVVGGSFWVSVKVATSDGIEGIGECYGTPVSGDIASQVVGKYFRALLWGGGPT